MGQDKGIFARYRGIIEKLQGTLENTKKKLKLSRVAYAREMQSKTELEELLSQCVEQVRAEINKKKDFKFQLRDI